MIGNSYILDTTEDDDTGDRPEEHIEKTAFRFPLMSEDWVRGLDENIQLGTYRHKVILIPYILSILFIAVIGSLAIYYTSSLIVAVTTVIVSSIILFIGLFRYWSTYYIITDDHIMTIEGLYTGSIGLKIDHRNIQESELNRGILGRSLDLVFDWGYGELIFRTASDSRTSSGEREKHMPKVKQPYHFKEAINEISDDE